MLNTEDLFTQNTEEYFMLLIYLHKILRNTICWEYLFTQNTEVEHYGKIYLHKILRNILLLVEHCGNIYLHKILGNIEHCENLFTQNIGEYFKLNTVGRFNYTKY